MILPNTTYNIAQSLHEISPDLFIEAANVVESFPEVSQDNFTRHLMSFAEYLKSPISHSTAYTFFATTKNIFKIMHNTVNPYEGLEHDIFRVIRHQSRETGEIKFKVIAR